MEGPCTVNAGGEEEGWREGGEGGERRVGGKKRQTCLQGRVVGQERFHTMVADCGDGRVVVGKHHHTSSKFGSQGVQGIFKVVVCGTASGNRKALVGL